MNHQLVDAMVAGGFRHLFEGVSVRKLELGHSRASQAGQMGPAPQLLPQLVRDAPDVGSRRNPAPKRAHLTLQASDGELFDLYQDRLQDNFLLLARQLVGRNALDFFGREDRKSTRLN